MGQIQLLTTGGTIASVPQKNGDVTAVLTGNELLSCVADTEDITVREAVTLGSYAFTYETLYKIGAEILALAEDEEVEGIVLTHGTDTMEETAFFLSMIVPWKKPIVLTGAQLNASHPSSDGPRNIADAVTLARDPRVGEQGPVIVFGGFIYSAREVKKLDTNTIEAFGSPGWGPVGRVDEDEVVLKPNLHRYPSLRNVTPVPVALIRLGIGTSGEEVARMVEGYKGVVIQAYGRGNAHPSISNVVAGLTSQQIPVLITSRCISGAVKPIYGNGGGRDLLRNGAIFVGDLSGEKARLLLGLMLANNLSIDEMQQNLMDYSK